MITEASTDNHCGRKNEQACWVAGAGHACGITTQCDYRSKGHHVKSTELDGKQNDQLAEHRPVLAGVHHRNAAGGQGGNRGEERHRKVAEAIVIRSGDGQHQ